MQRIGIFDSGYGGLSILRSIIEELPQYDYLYLGDNARAPYGTRSFECVYQFTLQAVKYLFEQGCPLVILACNTASAKALRSIQQLDLPDIDPTKRVLGVIRPTVEKLAELTRNGNIGLVGTPGTVASRSYEMEIAKAYPEYHLYTQACPMWVPIVENCEMDTPGAEYFVGRDVERLFGKCPDIDTLILGCTHYPLLYQQIRRAVPPAATVVSQGEIVAKSLADYLRRHPEMETRLSKGGSREYTSTERADKFNDMASLFMGSRVQARQVVIG